MNKLVIAALAVGGLSQAAGCVITTGNDVELDVAWERDGLFDYGDGCNELGASDVEVVTEDLVTGDLEIDVYNCSAGGATISRSPGDYDVWLNALDDGDLLGQSEIVTVELFSSDDVVVIEDLLAFLNGQFDATWLLTDESSGDALTCGEVGAGGFSVLSTLAGSGGTGFDDVFDCPAGATEGDVTTAPLPLGDYTVSVSLLEADTDEVLGQADPKDGSLVEHATVVDLGLFEFLFQ